MPIGVNWTGAAGSGPGKRAAFAVNLLISELMVDPQAYHGRKDFQRRTSSGYIRVLRWSRNRLMIGEPGRGSEGRQGSPATKRITNLPSTDTTRRLNVTYSGPCSGALKSCRQLRTAGFGFHGQILERARKISADVRMNLPADNDPNAFTARQRVRALPIAGSTRTSKTKNALRDVLGKCRLS